MHSYKCSLCQLAHCFRPISGVHGRKNICVTTDIFFTTCEKTLKTGIDDLCSIFGKMSSQLCLHHGRLMPMMQNHGDELSEMEVSSLTQFVSFTIQFSYHMYSKTDHGIKHNELYRLLCWLKNGVPQRYLNLRVKFNECTTSFKGFREFTFGLCCNVFASVRFTVNVAQQTFYTDLEFIHTAVSNE